VAGQWFSPGTLVSSARFTYWLDRLKPRASEFRGPPSKVYNIFLTLFLDVHIYAAIAYCTFMNISYCMEYSSSWTNISLAILIAIGNIYTIARYKSN
jgi:hypothetical protein